MSHLYRFFCEDEPAHPLSMHHTGYMTRMTLIHHFHCIPRQGNACPFECTETGKEPKEQAKDIHSSLYRVYSLLTGEKERTIPTFWSNTVPRAEPEECNLMPTSNDIGDGQSELNSNG